MRLHRESGAGEADVRHHRADRRVGDRQRLVRVAERGDLDGEEAVDQDSPGSCQFFEPAVGKGDGHRAVPHRAGHALDRAGAHVAGREHAGHARLERERVALQRPGLRQRAADPQVRAGEDEAARVERHARRAGPAGARHAAEAEEERARRQLLPARGHAAEVARAVDRLDLGAEPHLDQRVRVDALDEVRRHRLRERVAAHEHRHARARVREVHDRLAGRVARADDDHRVAAAARGLAAPGAVVDAAAEPGLDPVDVERAPVHPRRGDHHVRGHLVAAGDVELRALGRHPAAGHAAQQHQLGAEALGLAPRQPREVRALDAAGEAEEVLDLGGVGGLAARDVALDQQRREPVRGGVDRGRQPGRAGAHDREVVVRALRRVALVPGVRHALDRGRGHRAVRGEQEREIVVGEALAR